MKSNRMRFNGSARYLMLATAACAYVLLQAAGGAKPAALAETSAAAAVVQGATAAAPAPAAWTRKLCVWNVHSGGRAYGPCLMV
jgi:hypothetical protein